MKILSLDTSFSFLNLSVIEDGKVTLLYYEDTRKKSLELLPTIFKKLGLELETFCAFCVSLGVGYLTSLRVGITFMKTLAYLNQKPIYTYENLELMLKHTPIPPPKVAILKVGKNLFYRVLDENSLSSVKVWKGEPLSGSLIALRSHSIDFANYQLDLFPFSAYGALLAYERFLSGDMGEDVFMIEPYYTNSL
ncbi:tRNA threonylcarbamoyladenosine biosynthesis protein TsaB [Thermocrinis sp.]